MYALALPNPERDRHDSEETRVDIHDPSYAPQMYAGEELHQLAQESQAAIDAAGGPAFYMPPDPPSQSERYGLPHGPRLAEIVYADRFNARDLIDPNLVVPKWWADLNNQVGSTEPISMPPSKQPRHQRRAAAARRAGAAAVKRV